MRKKLYLFILGIGALSSFLNAQTEGEPDLVNFCSRNNLNEILPSRFQNTDHSHYHFVDLDNDGSDELFFLEGRDRNK